MPLVQKLVKLNAAGVIATHDLLLGSLAEKWPDTIENFRFEADINDNELSFSYKLQPGVAQKYECLLFNGKNGNYPQRIETCLSADLKFFNKRGFDIIYFLNIRNILNHFITHPLISSQLSKGELNILADFPQN